MKSLKIILVLIILVTSVAMVLGSNEKKTITFKVYGNCGMCKKNIETALDIKGVKAASWNVETKMLEVTFVPEQITEDKIHEAVAKAGYDTDKIKAKDEDYKNLHTCCQYRR